MALFRYPRMPRVIAAAAAACAVAAPAFAAPGVTLELNRFEPRDNACRISLVAKNGGEKALESLKLDLVFFDKDGVISRRLAVEAGPLRADKTTVKLFEATDVSCAAVSRVLLNDVTACGADGTDCLDLVSVSSRVKDVEFSK
ncbi:hypothetical protein GCM10008171_21960 [Methylopila jiangsuensis]|uniref:Tat pathway signal protein n=1 Tax=Methylopila jiangsuensis TaxID=586230 RepID=A0A9W6JH37_9HYPH|nr:hypothetical protein [Methylopila jiangsuensis]MDR6286713.1 hypothetical protein [Methylopila jiangsuensis]GLK76942.1 hypothetical protein GCM10008171_21960 [Methylopila jiangsuensis]